MRKSANAGDETARVVLEAFYYQLAQGALRVLSGEEAAKEY